MKRTCKFFAVAIAAIMTMAVSPSYHATKTTVPLLQNHR